MHFIRLRAAGRVPVQIQFARIIAPRDGQICHLIRRRAGRALRACIHARAHDLGFIARRRQVHISCQLRCCRQQRRNRRVATRRHPAGCWPVSGFADSRQIPAREYSRLTAVRQGVEDFSSQFHSLGWPPCDTTGLPDRDPH